MDLGLSWYILLAVLKWVFIGLVYLMLVAVVRAVRYEASLRLAAEVPPPIIAPGRLRVVRAGTDRRLQPDMIVPLQNQTTIGADQANDVVLGDPVISRRHARLRWDGLAWWVEDENSRNGTFVNEQRIPPLREEALPFGAHLRLGDIEFELLE
jgi:hypothetical protein